MKNIEPGVEVRMMNSQGTTLSWRGRVVKVVGSQALVNFYSPTPLDPMNVTQKEWPVAQLAPVD